MAGGRVPMVPSAMPVSSPMMMTDGVIVRVNVPMENGMVRLSRRK